mmetsp:Transcript_22540/g.47504  ORF Transcript_22540/g.47504 Transcript_22540/m.47504 type:complete len:530 (+) Transcript_22540:2085-3674(+)
MDNNIIAEIADNLLCGLCKKLPVDPVIAGDGFIYEKKELESLNARQEEEGVTTKFEFYRSCQVKRIIEFLVHSGNVDKKYLGGWVNHCETEGSPATHTTERGEEELVNEKKLEGEKADHSAIPNNSNFSNAPGGNRVKLGEADFLLAGLGVEVDKEEGKTMLLEAADEGRADAMLRLYAFHSQGVYGFKKSSDKARKWLNRLKKSSPQLSDGDIQKMKNELLRLMGLPCDAKETTKAHTVPCADMKVATLTPLEQITTTHEELELPSDKKEGANVTNPSQCNNVEMNPKGTSESPQQEPAYKDDASTGDGANIKDKQGVTAASTTHPIKQCSSCDQSKPKSSFSTSQWGKPLRTGKCLECCEKEGEASGGTISLKRCFSCTHSKERDAFTASQWKQPAGAGRCRECSNIINEPSKVDDEGVTKNSCQPKPDVPESLSHVKKCFECGQSKPQAGFTASQWKRRIGTGKCVSCVSKSPQWQTCGVASSLQTKLCNDCNVKKPHDGFSPNQWRRPIGTGRCKECVTSNTTRR